LKKYIIPPLFHNVQHIGLKDCWKREHEKTYRKWKKRNNNWFGSKKFKKKINYI